MCIQLPNNQNTFYIIMHILTKWNELKKSIIINVHLFWLFTENKLFLKSWLLFTWCEFPPLLEKLK